MLSLKVKAIFSEFAAIWLQKWLKPFENDDIYRAALKSWGSVLKNLDDKQIFNAIEKCKRLYQFPPSISEFLEIALEIPTFAKVRKGNDGSNFCEILYSRIDSYYIRQASREEVDRYLKNEYDALREEFLS